MEALKLADDYISSNTGADTTIAELENIYQSLWESGSEELSKTAHNLTGVIKVRANIELLKTNIEEHLNNPEECTINDVILCRNFLAVSLNKKKIDYTAE